MADIKKIKLPGVAEAYDIVDAGARTLISELESYSDYLGVTTTALTDGATTNPVTINGESVTAKKGNIVNYGSKEFIFNGTAWQEFGDLSALGDLAYVDEATGSYTPEGTITDPTVTIGGTATAAAQQVTIGGTASAAAQSITVTPTTTDVPNVTAVGSMPTYTVDANGVLTVTAGATPTLGTDITVMTGASATAAASSVDLTSVTATAAASSVNLESVTATAAASSVNLESVTATAAASSVDLSSVTAEASGSAFTGTAATITVGVSD